MNPALLLIGQPGTDMAALMKAIEEAAHAQGHSLLELPPSVDAGANVETRAYALMPDHLGVLLKTLHPNVSLIRRPS